MKSSRKTFHIILGLLISMVAFSSCDETFFKKKKDVVNEIDNRTVKLDLTIGKSLEYRTLLKQQTKEDGTFKVVSPKVCIGLFVL